MTTEIQPVLGQEGVQWLSLVGALLFGVVIGWVTYRTLRHNKEVGLGDIATVIGAVGGAAITALFPASTGTFGAYCVGLALGFFGYAWFASRPGAPDWLGGEPVKRAAGAGGGTGFKPPQGQ